MFETTYSVEWGDCDEAGIVFYPNFFYWLDCTFQRFLRQHGLSQRKLKRRFGAVTPIVHAESDFKAPARYDDVITITAKVQAMGDRRLRIDYNLTSGSRHIGTAAEIRAWAQVGVDGSIKGAPIDPGFLATCAISPRGDREGHDHSEIQPRDAGQS